MRSVQMLPTLPSYALWPQNNDFFYRRGEDAVVQWIGNSATRLSQFAENMPKSAFSKKASRPHQNQRQYIFLIFGFICSYSKATFPKVCSIEQLSHVIFHVKGFHSHIDWEILILLLFPGEKWGILACYRIGESEEKRPVLVHFICSF